MTTRAADRMIGAGIGILAAGLVAAWLLGAQEALRGVVDSWDGTRVTVRADPPNQAIRFLPGQRVTVTP